MTKDITKFKTDVTKAMNFMFPMEIPRSLLMNIASTPRRGVKSNDDNILNLKEYFTSTSISYGIMNASPNI